MAIYKQNVKATLAGSLRPLTLASTASGQTTGCWVAAEKCRNFIIVCFTGAGTSGTPTATYKIQVADDANGTNAADLTGYTSIASHTTTSAAAITVAELPASAVTASKYFSVVATTASGTAICSAAVLMGDPTYPA